LKNGSITLYLLREKASSLNQEYKPGGMYRLSRGDLSTPEVLLKLPLL